jgi:hypothetical protein
VAGAVKQGGGGGGGGLWRVLAFSSTFHFRTPARLLFYPTESGTFVYRAQTI